MVFDLVVVQLAVAHVIQVSIIAPMRVKPGVRAAPEAKDWDVHDDRSDYREDVGDKQLGWWWSDVKYCEY